MKRVILILALAGLTAGMQGAHRKLSLQQAVERKLVKATAANLGAYKGYCINITLKNLSPDSLLVYVEPGRRLNSIEDKYQDILVVKEEIIALKKSEQKTSKIKGYCCQAGNSAPQPNTVYAINKLADSNLVYLARFLNRGSFEQEVEQHAVWSISDKRPLATITAVNDSALMPLKQLVAGLKGEQLPWYSLLQGTALMRSGTILTFPLLLSGKLHFTSEAVEYATLYVYDEKGRQVLLQRSQWVLAGAQDLDLRLPVKGLEKGKYTIALRAGNRELAAKDFEI